MSARRPPTELSTAHEDYLETILAIRQEAGEVRVSAIAERLGVSLPPVTRAIQTLTDLGFVDHEARGDVRLTASGEKMAEALSHRHSDLVTLLVDVLGVRPEIAESDVCQMEHGLSPETAQRLHEFLEHLASLDPATRRRLEPARTEEEFEHLPSGRQSGWRA